MNMQSASEWRAEVQHSRTALLNNILLATVVGGFIALILAYISLPAGMNVRQRLIDLWPFLVGWLAVMAVWAWRGLAYRLRALALLAVVYTLGAFLFYRGGLQGSGRVWLLISVAMAFVLIGMRAGFAAALLSLLIYVFFAIAISQGWISQVIPDTTALERWVSNGGDFLLAIMSLVLILRAFNQGWSKALTDTDMARAQLQARTRELEGTTDQLRRRASQLQATTEIARVSSSILDPERLVDEAIHRIEQGFSAMGVYYVGLFLLDEARQFAVLEAATGEAGKLLLKMGHRLRADETTTVGSCVAHGEPRVRLNIEKGTARLDALPMPNTRSEAALPLRSRGRVLGALSVQSTKTEAFGEDDVAVLRTMADQVAVALDNARLFSQTENALQEVRALHQRYLAQEWEKFLAERPTVRIDYTQRGADLGGLGQAEAGDDSPLREARREALKQGRVVVVEDSSSLDESDRDEEGPALAGSLVIPLKLREQVIGTVALHETRHRRPWTTEDVALAETVIEQTAQTVENLRLMDETQRRAARERLIGEVTDRMRRAVDMDGLMKTAVEEMAAALGASGAFVQVSAPPGPSAGEVEQRRSG